MDDTNTINPARTIAEKLLPFKANTSDDLSNENGKLGLL